MSEIADDHDFGRTHRVIEPATGAPDPAPSREPTLAAVAGERVISPVAGRFGAGKSGKILAVWGLVAGCGVFMAATWTHPRTHRAKAGSDEPVKQVVDFAQVRAVPTTVKPVVPPNGADALAAGSTSPAAPFVAGPTLTQPGGGAPALSDGPVVPAIATAAPGSTPGQTGASVLSGGGGDPKETAARQLAAQQAARTHAIRAAPLLAYSAGSTPLGAAGSGPFLAAARVGEPAAATELDQLRRGSTIGTVKATRLPDRNFLLTAGAVLPCVLETALDSSAPGFVTCRVPKDVYSDSGGVVLLEKGSRVIGEYRSGFQQGRARIFVLWDRITTPGGVAVDVSSPASDALGRAGFDGHIDSHFWRRFGGALLLTTVSGRPVRGRHGRRPLRLHRPGAERGGDGRPAELGQHRADADQAARIRGCDLRQPGPRLFERLLAWRTVSVQQDASVLDHYLAPLAAMMTAADVTELVVNRPGEVGVEGRGGWRWRDAPDLDESWLSTLALASAAFTSQDVGPEAPVCSTVLPGGVRCQVVIPPAAEHVSLTLRKPAAAAFSLEDLEAAGLFEQTRAAQPGLGAVETELLALHRAGAWRRFLERAVETRQNILISGATGSGKTTLAKSLVRRIPPDERVITIEDARELTVPHRNAVHLLYAKDGQGLSRLGPKALLESALRMRPDRILLQELRDGSAWFYLRQCNTGHPGSITTIHADSAALALEQLTLLVRESEGGRDLPRDDIRDLLTLLVDVVVQLKRVDGRFRMTELAYDPLRKPQRAA